jgi:serine/threonine protein phosphatase PrpC
MADASPPKPGSLWARIMGLAGGDDAPSAGTLVEASSTDETIATDSAVVSLADPLPSTDPSPTVKLPPIPEFAQNPLAEEPERIAEPSPIACPSEAAVQAAPAALPPCRSCGTPRKPGLPFCDDCGYLFPEDAEAPPAAAPAGNSDQPTSPEPPQSLRLKGRYLLGKLISEKLGVKRYRGLDAGADGTVPVVIVQAANEGEPPIAEAVEVDDDDELVPSFDADVGSLDSVDTTMPIAEFQSLFAWPHPMWEKELLERLELAALPAVLDYFVENDAEYLILEEPQGELLWDAWDDPDGDAATRYGWLKQIAEVLDALHQNGALFECLSPDHLIVGADRHIRFTDLGDLIPLRLPLGAPLRGNLYTPPELIAAPQDVDARASLYSFGATLYSLEYLHHGLEESDFESQYVPKQVTDRFPDVHPLFPRLLNKTFVKDPDARFPTDEARRTDPTGFQELIQTLTVCQRVFDSVRLDIAAWTTTGMVRSGNEDAFAFLHGVDSRQDELYEYALLLLCDGMGGYEAGEVAAALAIAEMKKFFLAQPMFAGLLGKDPPRAPLDVEAAKKLFDAGLRHANKEVFLASRVPGRGKRGMGCTAEAIYIDPRHIVVGHIGDSRVYHLKDGRLTQLTRDQTLVNRLVELGQIRPEDAEDHPRKNELQQAVGGQPDVRPDVYHSRIKRGDWVIVCSDGLSNHIGNQELEKMLTREASNSAEEAARRLLNLVNLRGATDNATIVVVRAT